jgi:hypothetical protein
MSLLKAEVSPPDFLSVVSLEGPSSQTSSEVFRGDQTKFSASHFLPFPHSELREKL